MSETDGAETRRESAAARARDAAKTEQYDGTDDDDDVPRDRFPIADWDRYTFVGYLGQGGMGVVYRATDPQLRRDVALKFLLDADPGRVHRFIAEARSQARVEHEHVCKVYEVGTAHGYPYIAMQLIDGVTLTKAAAEMSLEDKVHVIRKVAEAVQAAHREGLIHRDLKTSNVMVERTEAGKWQPFVLDFGLAREVGAGKTIAGEIAGTPAFMAPEQARGGCVDELTDVWGVGATAYALLSGQPPNPGTTGEAYASLVTQDVLPIRRVAPRIPHDLATIVMTCLKVDPARRYGTVEAITLELRRFVAGEPIEAHAPSLAYRIGKRLRRSWRLAAALATALVALVAVLVLVMHAGAERRRSEQRVRVAHRFGEEVARIETFMRQAYAAPLHDIRPERAHVLDRMAKLQAEARDLGEVATGPLEYAVGRGYLSLHDHANARSHLEAALTAGYGPPEVRYALGLTLAALYQDGLAEAERIRDGAVRDARRAELRTTLRDPALVHLRAAGGAATETPVYVEGLIAFDEGDYATAVTKAEAAVKAAPWMYEALELAGDALQARAKEALARGAYADAAADLDRAGAEYTAAVAVAPSDPMLLGAECGRGTKLVALGQSMRQLDQAAIEAAAAPCERARTADPSATTWMVLEALILGQGGDYLVTRKGELPPFVMERGLPLVESALHVDPRSADACHARASLFAAQARAQQARREDSEHSEDEAIASFRRAIEIDPRAVDAYAELGFVLYERAKRYRENDRDPLPILGEAKRIVEQGLAVTPASYDLRGQLGVLWNEQAEHEVAHGGDARPALDKAIAAFDASLEGNASDGDTWNNLGLALQTRAFDHLSHGRIEGEADLDRAEQAYKKVLALGVDSKTLDNLGFLAIDKATHVAAMGRDPHPVVAEGVGYLRQALDANPAEENAYFNTATLWLIDAEFRVDAGEDPSEALAATQAAIDADLKRSAKPDTTELAIRSNAYVIAAQWAMSRKKSPAASLDAAETTLELAEGLGDVTAYVVDARARFEKRRAEWLISQGRGAAALARAQAAATQLTEVAGDNDGVRQLVADLALLEAHSLDQAKGADAQRRRADAIARARHELEAALANNPLLEHAIGPKLKQLAAM